MSSKELFIEPIQGIKDIEVLSLRDNRNRAEIFLLKKFTTNQQTE
jgi:hypothetical protein